MLLLSKLYAPCCRDNVLPRQALFQRLDGLYGPGITTLMAPAGFSKTTTVAHWLQCTGRDAAWLSVDKRDNDVNRFWRQVVTSLQSLRPACSDAFSGGVAFNTWLADFCSLKGYSSEKPLVLVWDGVCLLEDEQVWRSIERFLGDLPESVHLIWMARHRLAIDLCHWAHQGVQVRYLHASELSFSKADMVVFFQRAGLALASSDADVLYQKTEGWPAALQLVSLALRRETNASAYIKRFSGRMGVVAEFLLLEVLASQTVVQRQFLLMTASLPRLHPALCDAVTQRNDSEQRLLALSEDRCFVKSLPDKSRVGGPWYRYHGLFQELLVWRQGIECKDVLAIRVRAARWFESHQLWSDAIEQWVACEHWLDVVRVIELVAHRLLGRGEIALVDAWIEAVPAQYVDHCPKLLTYKAWVLSDQIKLKEARELLASASHQLDVADESQRASWGVSDVPAKYQLLIDIANVRAAVLRAAGDVVEASQHSRKALSSAAEVKFVHCAYAEMGMGQDFFVRGELTHAARWLLDAIQHGMDTVQPYVVVMSLVYLLRARYLSGVFQQGFKEHQWVREWLVRAECEGAAVACWQQVGVTELLIERMAFTEAEAHLRPLLACSHGSTMVMQRLAMHTMAVSLYAAQARYDLAREALLILEPLHQCLPTQCSHAYPAIETMRLWLDMLEGRPLISMCRLEQRVAVVFPKRGFLVEYEQLLLCSMCIEYGERDKAIAVLESIRQHAWPQRKTFWLQASILLSIALFHHGRTKSRQKSALDILNQALREGQHSGYLYSFIREKALMPLLRRIQGRYRSYAQTLLDRMLRLEQEGECWEALSPREKQVLQLISQGFRNRDIASKLNIAVETVKTHASNIYSKLQVSNRTEALLKARREGVLMAQ